MLIIGNISEHWPETTRRMPLKTLSHLSILRLWILSQLWHSGTCTHLLTRRKLMFNIFLSILQTNWKVAPRRKTIRTRINLPPRSLLLPVQGLLFGACQVWSKMDGAFIRLSPPISQWQLFLVMPVRFYGTLRFILTCFRKTRCRDGGRIVPLLNAISTWPPCVVIDMANKVRKSHFYRDNRT